MTTREERLAAALKARGQAGAAEKYDRGMTRESQVRTAEQRLYGREELLVEDRELVAARLQAQANEARRLYGELNRQEGLSRKTSELDLIANLSTEAAARIRSGSGALSDEERLAIGTARYPNLKYGELKAKFLTGERQARAEAGVREVAQTKKEAEAAGWTGSLTAFRNAQEQAKRELSRQEAIDQRNYFIASGKAIPGAYGRYVKEERGYNPQVSPEARRAAELALLERGKAVLKDEATGKEYVKQGNLYILTQQPETPILKRFEEKNGSINNGGDDRVVNSGVESGQLLAPPEEIQGGTEGFERRIKGTQEREENLREFTEGPGVTRIKDIASLATGGSGSLFTEYRGFVGQTAEKSLFTLLAAPMLAAPAVINVGEKVAATAEAVINPVTRPQVAGELSDAAARVEAGPFSFLPGGTPINPEGASTLVIAGLTAGPIAAGKVATGKGGFGPSGVKINVRQVSVPTETGPSVRYTGVVLETGSRGQPLVGVGKSPTVVEPGPVDPLTGVQTGFNIIRPGSNKVMVGSQPVDISGIKPGSGLVVETPAQAAIVKKSLPSTSGERVGVVDPQKGETVFYPAASAEILSEVQSILRRTAYQKSAFIRDTIDPRTETLSEPGVGEVLKFTREQEGFSYGSFAFQQQAPTDIILARGKVAGDIDVQLPKGTAEVSPAVDKLVSDLQRVGDTTATRASPDSTLIEAQGRHAVDIHTKDTAALDALDPNVAQETFLGFKLNQKPITIEDNKLQPASEQGVRKGTSIFTLRETPEGKHYFSPEAHRSKDVADFFLTQETLLRSKGLTPEQAQIELAKLKSFYDESVLKNPSSASDVAPSPNSPLIGSRVYPSAGVRVSSSEGSFSSSPSVSVISPASGLVASPSPSSSSRGVVIVPSVPVSPSASRGSSSVSISRSSGSRSVSPSGSSSPSPSPPSGGGSPSPTSPSLSPGSPSISPSPSPRPSSPSPSSPSPSPSPGFTRITPPPSPSIPPRPSSRSSGKELFDVEVRRKGQFRKESTQGLPLSEAVRFGETLVDTTAARSFKIVEQGTGRVVTGENKAALDRLLTAGRYRPAKADQNIIVERSRFAISTPGEKREIKPRRGIFGGSGSSPFGGRLRL